MKAEKNRGPSRVRKRMAPMGIAKMMMKINPYHFVLSPRWDL